jgi:hypothetical protein
LDFKEYFDKIFVFTAVPYNVSAVPPPIKIAPVVCDKIVA